MPAESKTSNAAVKRERDVEEEEQSNKKPAKMNKVGKSEDLENPAKKTTVVKAVKLKTDNGSSSSSSSSSTSAANPFLQEGITTEIHELLAPPPTRDAKGVFTFKDVPGFHPNLSPKEVLQMGSFGGTYFRSIYSSVTKKTYGDEVWKELPADWVEGLNIKRQLTRQTYDISVNRYKAKSGASLQEWEESGWMRDCDPYGWFQWYCRFFQGRRCADDERQIGRGNKCFGPKGRWKNNLCNKILSSVEAGGMIAPGNPGYPGKKTLASEVENYSISPVVRQTLQHWGYRVTLADFKSQK